MARLAAGALTADPAPPGSVVEPNRTARAALVDAARARYLLAELLAEIGPDAPDLLEARPGAAARLESLHGEPVNVAWWRERARDWAPSARLSPVVSGRPGEAAWRSWSRVVSFLAALHQQMGDFDRGAGILRRLVWLDPFDLDLRVWLIGCYFRRGDLGAAWREWRAERHACRRPPGTPPGPPWDGRRLDGRTLLVLSDLGRGDELLWFRYIVELAARRGARVILEASPALARLARGLDGVAEVLVVRRGTPKSWPPFDAWALPVDVAHFLAGEVPTTPTAPYVRPDPALVERWGELIDHHARGRLRVGLNLYGDVGLYPPDDPDPRAISLAELEPLARVWGVALFSLTKTVTDDPSWRPPPDGGAEASGAAPGMRITRLGPLFKDIADTAAAMSNLDVVITTDAMAAHLAGALGRSTWLLLKAWPAEFWETEGETTRWYPTMRVFRAERQGEWAPVPERLARELNRLARSR